MFKAGLVNGFTLVRVPVIILLAGVVSPDNPELATALFVLGLISHGFDGVLAKRLGIKVRGAGDFWHEVDTAYLSIGLQIATAVWLVRADIIAWWLIPAFVIPALVIEFGYIRPRKKAKQPFSPVIQTGSAVVWTVLTIALLSTMGAQLLVLCLVPFVLLHIYFHTEVWDRWAEERLGEDQPFPKKSA